MAMVVVVVVATAAWLRSEVASSRKHAGKPP
jgi:hypothetical protein